MDQGKLTKINMSLTSLLTTFLIILFFTDPWSYKSSLLSGVLSFVSTLSIYLGWYYFWRDFVDPLKGISNWNAATQFLFLTILVSQINPADWGLL
jgi:hypothetical protein